MLNRISKGEEDIIEEENAWFSLKASQNEGAMTPEPSFSLHSPHWKEGNGILWGPFGIPKMNVMYPTCLQKFNYQVQIKHTWSKNWFDGFRNEDSMGTTHNLPKLARFGPRFPQFMPPTYGVLPGLFAWPAGLGDIAIGVTAPLIYQRGEAGYGIKLGRRRAGGKFPVRCARG
jgi:hypothetical protein